MPTAESSLPQDWLALADLDIQTVRQLVDLIHEKLTA